MVVAPKAATGTYFWSTDKFAVDLNVQGFAVVRLGGGWGGGYSETVSVFLFSSLLFFL